MQILPRDLPEKIVQTAPECFAGKTGFGRAEFQRQFSKGISGCSQRLRHFAQDLRRAVPSNGRQGNARGCASASDTPPSASPATTSPPAAGRRENNLADSLNLRFAIDDLRTHQGTAARLGQLGAANQFKSVTTANTQIFRLDRHHGKDIRQIKNADQAGFAVGHFATGFRRNDLHPRPGRETEVTGDG